MKKKTLVMMYWIGTLLFFITLPSTKDVYLWHGIVLTCLASGLIAITLPKTLKRHKELKQVVSLYQDEAIDLKSRQEALDNGLVSKVWDKFFDCLISFVLLGMSVGLTVIGIGIICVKYF